MAYYTGYNGAVKEITQLPVGYNGAVVQSDGLYIGYQGAKNLVFGRYRWEKWDVNKRTEQKVVDTGSEENIISGSGSIDIRLFEMLEPYYGSAVKPSGGKLDTTLLDAYNGNEWESYPYIYSESTFFYYRISNIENDGGTFFVKGYRQIVESNEFVNKGDTLLGYESSDKSDLYPDNGEKNGFWYVKIQR